MAEITKPIALNESFNTTEGSPRNVADVLAQGIGDLVTVVSRISHQTTYDELSDLEDVNISAPTNGDVLTYDGSKWVNGQVGGGSVEQMIAPVETSTTASQSYAIGEQFILNGVLYTATAAITAGGTITINGNCTASDTVTEQIANINGAYSENEHIVGQWINGKTAYEKTINIGALPNSTTKTIAHNISNLSWVISLNGICNGSNTYLPLPFIDNSNITNNIRIDCNATNISVRTSGNYSSFSGYVTIRYTRD